MRLSILDSRHRLPNRLFLQLVRRQSGEEPHDVLKVLHYRPEFFGAVFCDLVHDALRGPSPWSVGERELFAAFTSRLNQCPF
jgi:hypothetical protein